MDYICEPCDEYTAKTKAHFQSHLKSLKHIKNQENMDKLKQQKILDDKNQQINDLLQQNQDLVDRAKIHIDECAKLQSNIVLKDIENKYLIEKIKLLTDHKNDMKLTVDMANNMAISNIN